MSIAWRIWLWAAIVRALKHVVPLQLLVRWLCAVDQTPRSRAAFEPALAAYLLTRGRFPRRPPGNCLDRSLAAYRLLCARGAHPQLVVGIRPEGRGLLGHVWLVVDGEPFAERGDVESYVSIVRFDERGRREPAAGAIADLAGIHWA